MKRLGKKQRKILLALYRDGAMTCGDIMWVTTCACRSLITLCRRGLIEVAPAKKVGYEFVPASEWMKYSEEVCVELRKTNMLCRLTPEGEKIAELLAEKAPGSEGQIGQGGVR